MNQSTLVAVIIAVIAVGAFAYQSKLGTNVSSNELTTDTATPVSETAQQVVDEEPSQTQDEEVADSATSDQGAPTDLSRRYQEYSETAMTQVVENDGKAVLFFAALEWCPSCQAADKDFKANLSQIPEDVTIFIVDYDTATDLKKEYSVVSQDTFVQIDSDGKELARWSGGGKGVKPLLANMV